MPERKFLIEIDGKPAAVDETTLASAKERALKLSEGRRAVMITEMGTLAPSEGHYWDYEISGWVHTKLPHTAKPQPKT